MVSSIEIRTLNNSDTDVLEDFLMQHVETSLFMLSNLSKTQVEYFGQAFEGNYIGAFLGESLQAVIVQYWNGNIMAQGGNTDLLKIWAFMQSELRPVQGFVGDNRVCCLLKDEYEKIKPLEISYALESKEVLYSLELSDLKRPQRFSEAGFDVRLATDDDVPFLLPWMNDYNVEALNAPQTDEASERHLEALMQRIHSKTCFVLWHDKKPLSTSSFNATVHPYVQVGGVWTPKEYRRQGFAQMAVAGSLHLARESGFNRAMLFTDEANVSARTAYERIGFQERGEFGLYII